MLKFTMGDAVMPEASTLDGGNITPTVAGAAGVLLGSKMPSASVDTGRVTFSTKLRIGGCTCDSNHLSLSSDGCLRHKILMTRPRPSPHLLVYIAEAMPRTTCYCLTYQCLVKPIQIITALAKSLTMKQIEHVLERLCTADYGLRPK